MKLKEVLNIPGMSGLYKMVAQTKSGLIVESLTDGKRQPVGSTNRVVPLSDIRIYTANEEMPLVEVFKKMDGNVAPGEGASNSTSPPPSKDSSEDAMKKYFKSLVPDIDEEKVHLSHMKKMLSWYELLKGKVDFNAKEEEGEDGESSILEEGQEKAVARSYETQAPKANQHAKKTTAKMRKKV